MSEDVSIERTIIWSKVRISRNGTNRMNRSVVVRRLIVYSLIEFVVVDQQKCGNYSQTFP